MKPLEIVRKSKYDKDGKQINETVDRTRFLKTIKCLSSIELNMFKNIIAPRMKEILTSDVNEEPVKENKIESKIKIKKVR